MVVGIEMIGNKFDCDGMMKQFFFTFSENI